jgi:DtxR family Mn-dependent transcriptional regulator
MEHERIELEDALKHLHGSEARGQGATMESLAGALQCRPEHASRLLGRLQEAELAEHRKGLYFLTDAGRVYALELIRAHRLYETYLARHTAIPETEWHREAHAAEHRMTREEVNALAQQLGYPRVDPHGDPIPRRDGGIDEHAGISLLDLPVGWEGTLVHVEDEPEAIYRRLVAAGFAAGMRLRLLARDAQGLRVNLEGREVTLTRDEAANLEGDPGGLQASNGASLPLEGERPVLRLSAVVAGEEVEVEALTPACRGAERRRLLDLGMVPGSRVKAEFSAAFGGPRAYRVRGSLIGLRHEQADQIIVRPLVATTTSVIQA